jgi:phosphocarrier protein HPr
MRNANIVIKTQPGLHLRIAGRLCEHARKSQSKIIVRKGDRVADGRSIIELLMLDAPQGSELEITAEGEDEDVVIAELEQVFIDGEGI